MFFGKAWVKFGQKWCLKCLDFKKCAQHEMKCIRFFRGHFSFFGVYSGKFGEIWAKILRTPKKFACSYTYVYCVKITWQQIFKSLLQVTSVAILGELIFYQDFKNRLADLAGNKFLAKILFQQFLEMNTYIFFIKKLYLLYYACNWATLGPGTKQTRTTCLQSFGIFVKTLRSSFKQIIAS